MRSISLPAWITILTLLIAASAFAQNPSPQPIPCLQITPSTLPAMISAPVGVGNTISSFNCVEDENNANSIINLPPEKQVYVKAGNEILLNGEVVVAPNSEGDFFAHIEPPVFDAVWYEPQSTPGFVGQYEKLELGFKLPANIENAVDLFFFDQNQGINPFNSDEIRLKVDLVAPSGAGITRDAFYYQPFIRDLNNDEWNPDTTTFNWRLRFAPRELGRYSMTVTMITPLETIELNHQISFVSVPSNNNGYLERAPRADGTNWSPFLRFSKTQQSFFAIGHNITQAQFYTISPLAAARHRTWLTQLGTNGGNFTRIEIGADNYLPDGENVYNYEDRLDRFWEFDQMVKLCEDLGIYFIAFRHHAEIKKHNWEDDDNPTPPNNIESWYRNAYVNEFGLTSRDPYFNDATIIHWQDQSIRYFFSRYGYSTNMSFYGFSEVDFWVDEYKDEIGGLEAAVVEFNEWASDKQFLIQNTLGYDHILMNHTYSTTPNFSDASLESLGDINGFHKYGISKDINWESKWKSKMKPIAQASASSHNPSIFEEVGPNEVSSIYCCTDNLFHNNIWSTAFMGCFGTAMHWHWNHGIHANGYYENYQHIAAFFQGEDLITPQYVAQGWSDKPGGGHDKAKLETFALRSDNKERYLGWVHNATFYWRNLYSINPCLDELIQKDSLGLDTPCVVEEGFTVGGPHEEGVFFQDPSVTDHYTNQGGYVTISSSTNPTDNPQFQLTKPKYNALQAIWPWAAKHWYEIKWYKTRGNVPTAEIAWTEVVHSTFDLSQVRRELKFHVPNLGSVNPDYSFKVSYLGFHQNSPKSLAVDTTLILEDSFPKPEKPDPIALTPVETQTPNLEIMPNPSTGIVQLKSSGSIQKVMVYDINGQILYHDWPQSSFHLLKLEHLAPGLYLVVSEVDNIIITGKLIIK